MGDYHFPLWKDSRDSFHDCLRSLFQGSPPTAILVQEPVLFSAVQQFLAARGVRIPGNVSLVCDDPAKSFAWQIPTVAHLSWEPRTCIQRLGSWADQIARGKADHRHTFVKVKLVDGGTIGPAPRAEG